MGIKSGTAETLVQARTWEVVKWRYVRAGLCDVCAAQAAWGHQIGFSLINPPCARCASIVASFPTPAVTPWRKVLRGCVSPPTSEPRCDHTDLLTSQCAHCLGHDDLDAQLHRERASLLATGRWVAARYPGRCAQCLTWFAEGAAIRAVDTHPGWIAQCCATNTNGGHPHG